MWCQILKSFQVNFAFCFEHAYFKRSARVYYKSEKKICWDFTIKIWHEMHFMFFIFFFMLHPRPIWNKLYPHAFLFLGVFWWAGVKASNEMTAYNLINITVLYIYWLLLFQLENSEVCHWFHFTPTHSRFVLLETSSHQQLPLLQELTMTCLPLVLILKASDCLDPS